MKTAEQQVNGRLAAFVLPIIGTVVAAMIIGWLVNQEAIRRDLEARVIRLESWQSSMDEWRKEGGRCTKEECDKIREEMRQLQRRVDRVEPGE